jgi:hypothetical protein
MASLIISVPNRCLWVPHIPCYPYLCNVTELPLGKISASTWLSMGERRCVLCCSRWT